MLLQRGRRTFAVTIASEHGGILARDRKWSGLAPRTVFINDLALVQGSSPCHYEFEEEWLLVLDGTIVQHAPDGEHTLERGDLARFPSVRPERTS